MNSLSFRKTLIAIAITAATLPAYAETLVLTDAGLTREHTRHESLEVTGAFTAGNNSELDAIDLSGVTIDKDLVLNATINAKGDFASGLDMDSWGDNTFVTNTIGGDMVNKGNITVVGNGSSALLIDPAVIGGDLINEGTLSVKGEPLLDTDTDGYNPDDKESVENATDNARAVDFSGSSHVSGDFINAASGKILVEGTDSTGILMSGGRIDGKLINNGLIQVTGSNATAIDATTQSWGMGEDRVDLGGIVNNGTIIAKGEDAVGLELDGVSFAASSAQVVNTGVIQATDAAIEIGGFDIDTTVASPSNALWIRNSGTITSEDEAVDASEATGTVYLALEDGSKITGNLIGLSNIETTGNVSFTGTDASADGANIRMANGGWFDIGGENRPAHLALTQPHTTLDGNLAIASGSSLDLALSNQTDPAKAILSVSGTAEFEAGAQVKLAAADKNFTATSTQYTLLSAKQFNNGAQNDNLKVVSSSSLLNVDSFKVSDGKVVSVVTTKSADEVGEVIGGNGGSSNAKGAGAAFSQVLGKFAGKENDAVYKAFTQASESPAALAKLSEQLAPEVNGGSTQAALSGQTLISNVTGGRTASTRQGLASGEGFKDTGVWVQGLYSDATQNDRNGVAGYNAYSNGIAIGADGKLNEQLTLGIAYSHLSTDVNSASRNKTEVEGDALTLYSGFELDNYFVDASLTYGLNDNTSKRRVAGTTAKGDYDSDVFGVNVMGGYTFRLDHDLLIEPRVAARYSQVNIDSYREKNSSAALAVDSQRFEVAELGAGLRLASSFNAGAGKLEPQARLMAYHDFAGDRANSTSTFLIGGTPFATNGAKPARDSIEAGVGVDYKLGAVTVGVSYDYLGKEDFNADTFQAKVRYNF